MEIRRYCEPVVEGERNRGTNSAGLTSNIYWKVLTSPPREFPPATSLFVQGQAACEVFYVEQGMVKLTHIDEGGKELIVGLRSKGHWLGAAPTIVQESHQVTAVTVNRCSLSIISADTFLRLARTDEQFGWHLQQVHSREVNQQMSQIVALGQMSAKARLENLLLQFLSSIPVRKRQTLVKVQLPLKHWEIAQLLGITPEHLSRVFKQIKQDGVMCHEDGYIIVSDINKLCN